MSRINLVPLVYLPHDLLVQRGGHGNEVKAELPRPRAYTRSRRNTRVPSSSLRVPLMCRTCSSCILISTSVPYFLLTALEMSANSRIIWFGFFDHENTKKRGRENTAQVASSARRRVQNSPSSAGQLRISRGTYNVYTKQSKFVIHFMHFTRW